MADTSERQAAQAREYEQALDYLRHAGNLEDGWILRDERPYWRLADLEGPLALSDQSLRNLARLGVDSDGDEGFPGAFMHSPQAGWQVPRRGVVVYLARRAKAMRRVAGGERGQQEVG